MLNRAYRYIALTRASTRLYVFAEDMRRWVYAPRPATAQTAGIIQLHNLDLDNGWAGNDDDNRVVAVDDTEFEAQAEWSSLLWWLQKQHTARSGTSFKRIDRAWYPMEPMLVAIAHELYPGILWVDTKWDRCVKEAYIGHFGWDEDRTIHERRGTEPGSDDEDADS